MSTEYQFDVTMQLTNAEAELNVLGIILYENEKIKDCLLQPEHFGVGWHKGIMRIMRELDAKEKPIEPLTLIEEIGQKRIEELGGMKFLNDLAASAPTAANFTYYQNVVFEYYEKRRMYEIGRDIMQKTISDETADISDVRQDVMEELNKLENGRESEHDGHIGKGLVTLYKWMEEDHGEITGAPSGFTELDRMLSGFQKQDLVIIGARPSVGKTAFATNVCLNYSSQNGPVGIFSLEMSEQQLLKRMISNYGNVNAQKMRSPRQSFSDDDWRKATISMGELKKMPFHIFDKSGADMSYIRQECRNMKKLYPGQHILIMVDYLQLIVGSPKHGGNRTAEISEISRLLKHLARELDITIIALSQLSRGVEQRQDKRPMMSDLRESGQIEQDADVIGFLYRDDYYDKETEAKNIIEIIIAKQRNGPVGTVELAFIKEYSKFVNLERRLQVV